MSLLALLTVSILLPSQARAQGVAGAAIHGQVVDEAGQAIADARVEAKHEPTGAVSGSSTDREGRYHLPNLRAGGPYTVTVSRMGYALAAQEGVTLQAGSTIRLEFVLQPEALVLPGVQVRAQVDTRFDASRTGPTVVMDRRAVTTVPTIERNVRELTVLSPMAIATEEGISIAGQNDRFNGFLVDGAPYQDVFGFSSGGVPGSQANAKPLPLQAVDQYQVLVAPFDVRQSGFTGGILNVVTRSGTNRWEASGFGHARNHAMIGDLRVDDLSAKPEEYENAILGFAIGGPLRQDRAHVFVAAEVEHRRGPPLGYSLGAAQPERIGVLPDSAAILTELLRERYGTEPGEVGPSSLANPSANVFGRIDWSPGSRHRLTVRYNFAGARMDEAPNRQPFGAYELSSHGYRFSSSSHAGTVQLVSTLSRALSNQIMISHQRSRDEALSQSDAPRVEVHVQSEFPQGSRFRWVRAGGNPFADANELEQRVVQLRNDLTATFGDHVLTFGAGAEWTGINSLFLPFSRGSWRFANLQDLRDNSPYAFERNLTYPDADPRVEFSMVQLSAHAQNEWLAPGGLMLRAGMRVDLPILGDRPERNEAFQASFRQTTASLPPARPQFSPRLGFNWQAGGRLRTQLRGGAGLFTGRPPLVWVASAYAYTGLTSAFISCYELERDSRPNVVPGFTPGNPPEECANGRGIEDAAPIVTVFADDFRFPQDLKLSLGADQELPAGFSFSTDIMFSEAIRQIMVEDLNLGTPVRSESLPSGLGFPRRPNYGTPAREGFTPRRLDSDFGQVVRVGNTFGNATLATSFQLAHATADRLRLSAAYTFTQSVDTQSLIGRDAPMNVGLTPTTGYLNEPVRGRSVFDRPHKLLATAWLRAPDRLSGTELSLLYVGQSGTPYSYVYAGDMNGDGYPGPGTIDAYNDLIHVPTTLSELPGSIVTRIALLQLVEAEPCLAEARGRIVQRNTCRTPWSNRLDLRVVQPVRVRGAEIRLTGDLMNVLNLLNDDWGRVQSTSPVVPILTPSREDGELWVRYAGATQRDPETGRLVAPPPYSHVIPASQWQAQVGVQVTF